MDRSTFAQMVDFIEDWWGPSNAWAGAERLYPGFANIDEDAAFEVLMGRQSDTTLAKYPPKPAELKAAALDVMRRVQAGTPQIAESTDRYDWATHSERTYGKVIGFDEAVAQRWAELAEMGKAVVPRVRQ